MTLIAAWWGPGLAPRTDAIGKGPCQKQPELSDECTWPTAFPCGFVADHSIGIGASASGGPANTSTTVDRGGGGWSAAGTGTSEAVLHRAFTVVEPLWEEVQGERKSATGGCGGGGGGGGGGCGGGGTESPTPTAVAAGIPPLRFFVQNVDEFERIYEQASAEVYWECILGGGGQG